MAQVSNRCLILKYLSVGFYSLPFIVPPSPSPNHLLQVPLLCRPTCVCMLSHFSRVQFFATPWTVAHQAPLFMGFSRQEYWSGLPCPPPGDLPDPGIELNISHITCIGRWVFFFFFLPLVPPGKPANWEVPLVL